MKSLPVVVLGVLGVLAVVAAILYFALPAHSLPGFLPGHVAGVTGHRSKRGIAALVLAVIFFGGAAVVQVNQRRSLSA
jgi:hypothetical protein